MIEPCNNTSVGILVRDSLGHLLLIERANYPPGFAPPAGVVGQPARSTDETRSMRWVNAAALHRLADRTALYLAGDVAEVDWQASPGLEPVWLDMLTGMGLISRAR